MKFRTFFIILLSLLAVVAGSYVYQRNADLLGQPFALGAQRSVPLWGALLAVFFLGFLPTVAVLLIDTLRADLKARKRHRKRRAEQARNALARRAEDSLADGQWTKAEREFSSLLLERPEDYAGLLGMGATLRGLGKLDEALEVHRRASVLYPQSVTLLYELAEDYAAAGEPDVASEVRNRVLREFSGSGLRVLKAQRATAMASGDWRRALELQEKIEVLAEPADLRSEADVRRGLKYERGVASLRDGEIDEAKRLFHALLEEEPNFVPASIMLGEALLLEDRPEAAAEEWQRGYEQTGSPTFLQRLEDHYIEVGDPSKAIQRLHALAGSERVLMPRFFLGRLYYRLEMHDEAAKVLAEVDEPFDRSPTYHLLLARIAEKQGDRERATAHYHRCVKQAGLTVADYLCGACAGKTDDWSGRCEECGAWNSIELDFEEEQVSSEAIGLSPRPVWTVREDAEAAS